MPAKHHRSVRKSRARKSSKPKSREACAKRNMLWVKKHMSKSAKGKKIVVRGSCRKSPRRM